MEQFKLDSVDENSQQFNQCVSIKKKKKKENYSFLLY